MNEHEPILYRLANKRLINLNDLKMADLSVELIALGLSRESRFGGQFPMDAEFYSVAEHSVWVSRLVPPELAMYGLFHESMEGLGMKDLPAPIKRVLPDYKKLERKGMAVVAMFLGLDPNWFDDLRLKVVDIRMFETENVKLRGNVKGEQDGVIYDDVTLWKAPPWLAYQLFMERYHELMGRPGWKPSIQEAASSPFRC